MSPLPWRRGGAVVWNGDKFEESFYGTGIWGADGEPVLILSDWFDDEDIDALVAAVNARATPPAPPPEPAPRWKCQTCRDTGVILVYGHEEPCVCTVRAAPPEPLKEGSKP